MDRPELGTQVLGKVQIRNAKEVFWDIVSVDQHARPQRSVHHFLSIGRKGDDRKLPLEFRRGDRHEATVLQIET
jgi:hypothetical protein